MSDANTPTPPPLPPQPAGEAARSAGHAASDARPQSAAHGPNVDIDDTGVPAPLDGEVLDVGRGFFSALFDLSFRTFITRRLASVFYIVGLIAIAIGFLVYFVTGLVNGIAALFFNPGAGISLIISTIILVPLITFIAVIALRFVIEGLVALISIAENTQRTAENTDRQP